VRQAGLPDRNPAGPAGDQHRILRAGGRPGRQTLLQLAALLRNRSPLAQNLPYLELTLLDAQEAPLVRRVLKPEEYAQRNPPSARQLPADSEYQVKLSLDVGALKANGYRLYAFYP